MARWPLLLCLILAACSRPVEPPGKAQFESTGCMGCHRIGPVGGVTGPDLNYVGFRHSREWIARWLADPQAWKPGTKMPNFALRPPALAALADYLSTLQGQEYGTEGPPWKQEILDSDPVRRGAVIYLRAGCATCHGVGGAGGQPNNNVPGNVIPALDKLVSTYTLDELKAKIRFGATSEKADLAGPTPLVSMPAWGKVLTEPEIADVAGYLMTLQAKGSKDSW